MTQIAFQLPTQCNFFGCVESICRSNAVLPPHCKKYCQHHSDEIDTLFEKKYLPGIIAWKRSSERPKNK